MKFPIEKYNFYIDEKNEMVIAVSSYAGRTVKGKAKCDPRDEFDLEKGKKLAAARCNAKVAKKRSSHACNRLKDAERILHDAYKYYGKMCTYASDACNELEKSEKELNKLLGELND